MLLIHLKDNAGQWQCQFNVFINFPVGDEKVQVAHNSAVGLKIRDEPTGNLLAHPMRHNK
jgi:hypothetical protein